MKLSPLLLSDPSPCLRWLVLRRLFGYAADHPEVQELVHLRQSDPLLLELLDLQSSDGEWSGAAPSRRAAAGRQPGVATGFMLSRLGYLGFGPVSPRGAARRESPSMPAAASRWISCPLPQEADLSDMDVGDHEAGDKDAAPRTVPRTVAKTKHLPGGTDTLVDAIGRPPYPCAVVGGLRLRRRPVQRRLPTSGWSASACPTAPGHRHRFGRLPLRGWLPPAGALACWAAAPTPPPP